MAEVQPASDNPDEYDISMTKAEAVALMLILAEAIKGDEDMIGFTLTRTDDGTAQAQQG